MPDFKAKMHQIRFPLQCSSRPLAVFEESTSKRRERGDGRKGKERKGKGEGRRVEVEEGIWSTQKFWRGAPYTRPIVGFKGAASRGQRVREGRGLERKREKRGRKKKKGGRKVGTGPPIG